MHGYSESPTVLPYSSNTTIYDYYNDIYSLLCPSLACTLLIARARCNLRFFLCRGSFILLAICRPREVPKNLQNDFPSPPTNLPKICTHTSIQRYWFPLQPDHLSWRVGERCILEATESLKVVIVSKMLSYLTSWMHVSQFWTLCSL